MKRIISLGLVLIAASTGCVISPAVFDSSAATTTDQRTTAATPEVTFDPAESLVTNYGFEEGVDGGMYYPFGTCQVKESTSIVHGGDRSAYVTFRVQDWNGLGVDLTDIAENGVSYQIVAWVYMEDVPSASVSLTGKRVDATGEDYKNITTKQAKGNEWVKLSGKYAVKTTGDVEEVTVYIEGPDPDVSFYVDDLAVYALE